MLAGRDDPTVGTERFLVAALQEFSSVIESELRRTKNSTFEEPKTLLQVAPSYQKLIIIANINSMISALQTAVDVQALEEMEHKVTKLFIEEQVKVILPWVLQDTQSGISIVYRLLRELSEVDRQISEIDTSLSRKLLILLVSALLEALSHFVVGKGRQARLDGLIIKSILAAVINEEAAAHLEKFLTNNPPLPHEEALEDGGQGAIDAFKQKNPILVSIFTF